MNDNDIVGAAALLAVMLAVWFFSTPAGMILLGLLIAAGVAATAYDSYATHEPWTTFEPNKRGWREVVAQGYMDAGYFVLTREGVASRNGVHPRIMTLSLFKPNGELVSTVAKLIARMEDDGKFIIGRYRGRDVVIDADRMFQALHQTIGEPNGTDTWQVYPPQPQIPFGVSRCPHPWSSHEQRPSLGGGRPVPRPHSDLASDPGAAVRPGARIAGAAPSLGAAHYHGERPPR